VLKSARENNVVFLALPSHTSHLIQPLDKCVFSSLQEAYKKHSAAARLLKPEHTLALRDFPALIREALPEAATPRNILAGFKLAGVWPQKPVTASTAPSSIYIGEKTEGEKDTTDMSSRADSDKEEDQQQQEEGQDTGKQNTTTGEVEGGEHKIQMGISDVSKV